MLPITPLVRWPKGEMKNSRVVLILKTLNTLILSSQGCTCFGFQRCHGDWRLLKTISGFVLRKQHGRTASQMQNARFITTEKRTNMWSPPLELFVCFAAITMITPPLLTCAVKMKTYEFSAQEKHCEVEWKSPRYGIPTMSGARNQAHCQETITNPSGLLE